MSSNLNQQQIIDIAKAVAEILKPTITEIVKTTISEIFKQQSNSPNDSPTINTPWGCPPLNIYSSNLSSQCQIAQTINNAIINSETIKAKSLRAVIEKLPEVNDEVNNIIHSWKQKHKTTTHEKWTNVIYSAFTQF